jgi:acetoin utilization deacetylase AcuC-like enzyme
MVSTFERGLYPYNGEVPIGPNMCNVPLERYSRGDAMRDAVARHWRPALDAFRPQMVFCSAGFDAHREDDMSHLMWVEGDYAWLTREIMSVAERGLGCHAGETAALLRACTPMLQHPNRNLELSGSFRERATIDRFWPVSDRRV